MKLFAWCDSPLAPTGFGRSAQHVLHALHEAGWEIVQLAINQDPSGVQAIPWKVYLPDRNSDPYGLRQLAEVVREEKPDLFWATFDPEVPWKYGVPGAKVDGKDANALDLVTNLRKTNPGMRAMGWFPVDGGPLSNFEMAVLGAAPLFDYVATMSSHVHDLMEWTLRLRGHEPDRAQIESRLHVIPHGIDFDLYKIPTAEERLEARRKLNLPEEAFIIAQVERNQQRKQNYFGLDVMERLLKRTPELRGKAMLYQHMLPDEESQGCQLGYNLPELSWRYGLKAGQDVIWPRDFLPTEMMPLVYQAADVFLSTSTGEGFQYPAWEALVSGLPIVVPNDSARKAWFKDAPNAHLYSHSGEIVMRGGYQRRMNMPNPAAAAGIVRKLWRKPPKNSQREAGRAWAQRVADVKDVRAKWVAVAEMERRALVEQRRDMQIVTEDDVTEKTVTVAMDASAGLGDLILAAPALVALAKKHRAEGRRTHLRVSPTHLSVARFMGCADAYEIRGTAPCMELLLRVEEGDPTTHRTDLIAKYLGLDVEDLKPLRVTLPTIGAASDPCDGEGWQKKIRAQFLDTFGIDPAECVGIACESSDPHRALPMGYIHQLEAGVRSMGRTPVVLGRTALSIQRLGTIDMTGKTSITYMIGLIDQLAAVISTDSAPLHIAGMLGTPLVGCFTLFDPDTRLRYYAGDIETVTAAPIVGGEDFPAGHGTKLAAGAWAATITPDEIMQALRRLLKVEATGPKVVRP